MSDSKIQRLQDQRIVLTAQIAVISVLAHDLGSIGKSVPELNSIARKQAELQRQLDWVKDRLHALQLASLAP